ncbi:MAG: metal-dependent transcriptional regulator [Actinobacteria bacterium]|nr:metal-dependent transcriptional regulator [Actinomycetota bacterium]
MKSPRNPSARDFFGDYLKHIFRLQQASSPVSTTALAESMGLAPSTVTDTLKKLSQKGLINYTPYHGITLTPEGEKMAVKAIRRHRIVERFLTDMLGFEWHEAHEEALPFENQISEEVERRLFVALNRPKVCPHGYPIPSKVEDVRVEETTLYSLEPGERAEVISVKDDEPELLQFMASLGIKPGVRIRVITKDPFKGPLQAVVGRNRRTVGWHLANSIYVRKLV